jgi:hypothetical protein
VSEHKVEFSQEQQNTTLSLKGVWNLSNSNGSIRTSGMKTEGKKKQKRKKKNKKERRI